MSGGLLVYLTGPFAKVALICLVAWFATDVANDLLLLDLAVWSFQLVLMFGLFLILLILSFEPVLN